MTNPRRTAATAAVRSARLASVPAGGAVRAPAQLWFDHRNAGCVIVAVHADNIGSWRALEKAGLTRVAHAELDPDNPVDDRRHVIYRIDRPTA